MHFRQFQTLFGDIDHFGSRPFNLIYNSLDRPIPWTTVSSQEKRHHQPDKLQRDYEYPLNPVVGEISYWIPARELCVCVRLCVCVCVCVCVCCSGDQVISRGTSVIVYVVGRHAG